MTGVSECIDTHSKSVILILKAIYYIFARQYDVVRYEKVTSNSFEKNWTSSILKEKYYISSYFIVYYDYKKYHKAFEPFFSVNDNIDNFSNDVI